MAAISNIRSTQVLNSKPLKIKSEKKLLKFFQQWVNQVRPGQTGSFECTGVVSINATLAPNALEERNNVKVMQVVYGEQDPGIDEYETHTWASEDGNFTLEVTGPKEKDINMIFQCLKLQMLVRKGKANDFMIDEAAARTRLTGMRIAPVLSCFSDSTLSALESNLQ